MAVFPPGDAREDWKILRAFSEVIGHRLPYDSLAAVRSRMAEINPVFAREDSHEPGNWGTFGAAGTLDAVPFVSPIDNFYQTDPISRASDTMAQCVAEILGQAQAAE